MNRVKNNVGFDDEVSKWTRHFEVTRRMDIILDEMTIQSDLQINKRGALVDRYTCFRTVLFGKL